MGLTTGMRNSFVLAGRSGSRDNIGLHDFKHLQIGIVERMIGCAWEVSGMRVVLLLPCFKGGVAGSEALLEQVQLNLSRRN